MTPRERVLVALDTPSAGRALELARALAPEVGGFKVGLELFTTAGPDLVQRIRDLGGRVFVDLKLHDIPNTVAGAATVLGRLGVSLLTVHGLGGPAMIRSAVEASAEGAASAGQPAPRVLAVTILTSHDDTDLASVGVRGPCGDAVLRLAAVARDAGAAGVVCSALEVDAIRSMFPEGLRVVPGIRPAGAAADDQARTATPAGAVERGADYLVIGRPITRADDPVAAARAIATEIGTAGR